MRNHLISRARTLLTATVIALVALLAPGAADAQSTVVALVDTLPVRAARAVILRNAARSGEDIILLRQSEAEAGLLVGVLGHLVNERRTRPAPEHMAVVVLTEVDAASARSSSWGGQAAAILKQLAAQPLTQVGNVGRGRWMRLSRAQMPE